MPSIEESILALNFTHNPVHRSELALVLGNRKRITRLALEENNTSDAKKELETLGLATQPISDKLIFAWINPKNYDPEFLKKTDLNDLNIQGIVFNYPQCCLNEYQKNNGNLCAVNFYINLKQLYRQNNRQSLHPFVGLSHIPCSLTCKDTLQLDYGSFLLKQTPIIYKGAMNELIRTIKLF